MSFELRVAGLSKTYANGVRVLDKVSLLRVENQGYIHYRKGSLVYVRPARVCTPCAMPWARRRSTARSSRSRWGPAVSSTRVTAPPTSPGPIAVQVTASPLGASSQTTTAARPTSAPSSK